MTDSFGEELRCGGDGKVARHFSPHVVELIRLAPNIGAGARDPVLPGGGIKLRCPLQGRSADVIGMGKAAERSGLRESGSSEEAKDQEYPHVQIVSELLLAAEPGIRGAHAAAATRKARPRW